MLIALVAEGFYEFSYLFFAVFVFFPELILVLGFENFIVLFGKLDAY